MVSQVEATFVCLVQTYFKGDWDNWLRTPKLAWERPWGPLYPMTSQGPKGAWAGGRGHPYTAGDWLTRELVQYRTGVDQTRAAWSKAFDSKCYYAVPHLGSFIATNLFSSFSPPLVEKQTQAGRVGAYKRL